MKIENIIKRYERLEQNKKHFNDAWEDARKYASPNSPPIYGKAKWVSEKERDNYDSTAELAARNLASVVMTSSTPPDQKWINFKNFDEEAVEGDFEALEYIDYVEDIVIEALNSSNFYIKKYEFDKYRIVFGTGVMFVEEGKGNKDLNFRTIHIADVALAEDSEGYVDSVYRTFYMPIRDLVQKFGLNNLSREVKDKYEHNPFEEIKCLHCVYPRNDDERERDSKGDFKKTSENLPYTDIWIEYETQHKIEEGGFRTFPFVVSRWEKEVGDVYGHGPVMDALADIKTLNRMERSKVQLAEKINNPPKIIIGAEKGEVDFTPAATNHFDEDVEVKDLVSGANYPVTSDMVQNKIETINQAMYVNQFQSLDRRADKEMTAAEVDAIRLEALRILAPVLGRNQPEILHPLMIRVLDILDASGRLPPQPEGIQLVLEPVNELTRAMKMSEVNAVRSVIMHTAQMAEINPEVIDNINFDAAYELLKDATGIPNSISNSEEDIKAIREGRAKQQQEAQQMQMAMVQAELKESSAKAEEKSARAENKRKETYSE
jgi:hypothetical protein